MTRSFVAVVSLLAALAVPRLAAAEEITLIVVYDNTKTTDETVRLIAGIEEGDDFGPDDIDRVRSDLVNSGLFKHVEVFTAPYKGGLQVNIVAKDKHSWVIAPTYYDQPTNRGGGIGFGENNLFGENKKLLMYGQIATGDSFFIAAYVDPSIAGTRFKWQIDTFLQRQRVIEYASPTKWLDDPEEVRRSKMNYLNAGIKGGVNLFRGASFDVRLRGAHVAYDSVELAEGAEVSDVTDDPDVTPETLPAPGAEGWDVSTELILQYDTRANWYGITSGDKYTLTFERALPGLGSDFDYWYGALRFERARKFFSRHNLILRTMVGYGRDTPFQQEWQNGGTGLRGYRNGQFRGDFKVGGNLEYSIPIINVKGVALRGLTFWDSSYVAFLDTDPEDTHRSYLPGHERLGLAPFKNSVGVGTRLYIRQIVLPLLGLDLGYGLERGEFEIYFAVGLTDL